MSFPRRFGKTAIGAAFVLAVHTGVCLAQSAPQSATSSPATESRAVTAQKIDLATEREFARDHDLEKAWTGFVAANRADPSYAPAWFNMAVLLEGQRKWRQAQDDFKQYLTLAPKGADAIRALEQVRLLDHYVSGEMTPADIARADYDSAIQRARALAAAGFYREAIADAGLAQALNSSRWEAYAVVSICMYRQNKLAEAARMKERALALAPDDRRAQLRVALSPQHAAEAGR